MHYSTLLTALGIGSLCIATAGMFAPQSEKQNPESSLASI